MVQTVARQTVTPALHSLPAHNVLTASLKVGADVFAMDQSEMESVSLAMQMNTGTETTVLSAPS